MLPLPLSKTKETLKSYGNDLLKPEFYIKVDGEPTKKKVIWRKIVNIKKVKAALTTLKKIYWLYGNIKLENVDKTAEDVVLDLAHSATS